MNKTRTEGRGGGTRREWAEKKRVTRKPTSGGGPVSDRYPPWYCCDISDIDPRPWRKPTSDGPSEGDRYPHLPGGDRDRYPSAPGPKPR